MGQLDTKGVKDSASASNIQILYEPGSLITRQRMTFQHFTLTRLAMFRLSNCKKIILVKLAYVIQFSQSQDQSVLVIERDPPRHLWTCGKTHGKHAQSKAYLYAEHVEPADMELTLDLALSSDARKNLE